MRGEANCVIAEDLTTVLALLDERRDNVITQRTSFASARDSRVPMRADQSVAPGAPMRWVAGVKSL